jgi:cobalt-zinc-cadmium resistance protein CzcA
MLEQLIKASLHQCLMVLLVTVLMIGAGLWAFQALPIDAFPDVTTVQVQVITKVPALSPLEVERLVTFPLEIELANLPGKTELRSVSKFGLSVITVVFADSVDIYFGRQLVLEKVIQAKDRLPSGAEPTLGPVSTGLGEVYQYIVEGPGKSLMELRTLQDWIVRPFLRTVPGLADVDTLGGVPKQYQVLVDPEALTSFALTLHQVYQAVAENNTNASGSYIERGGDKFVVYGIGLARSIEDLERIVVSAHKGTPVYLKNVARVQEGGGIRLGAVTRGGEGEVVSGIAVMLRGENSLKVVERVKEKVKVINGLLPLGVEVVPYYERTKLTTQALDTVKKALMEGAVIVIVVLYLFLRNLRGPLVVALTFPLATLATFLVMHTFGLSANLMSLGGLAISLGMIADAAIIQVENVDRHLSQDHGGTDRRDHGRLGTILPAVLEVLRPSLFGVLIIALTFLPILALEGMEGKMFRPLALTVIMALLSSLLLSVTVIPVLCSLLLQRWTGSGEARWFEELKRLYGNMLRWTLAHGHLVVVSATVALLLSLALFPFIGKEFVPTMDEGSIVISLIRLPSIALTESLHITGKVEQLLRQIPEVRTVVSRTGANELGTDPMGMEASDMYVLLKPRAEWRVRSKAEIEDRIREMLKQVPGIAYGLSQPIQMRVDELVSGIRSAVAVKLFGEDLEILKNKGDEIAKLVALVSGVTDVRAEQIAGLYYLQMDIDRARIARYGINVADVSNVIETAVGGKPAGEIFEGQRRFPVVVRFPVERRNNPETIGALLVSSPDGSQIPLRELAQIQIVEGPAQVSREDARRRRVIEFNVERRDLVGTVEEAEARVASEVKLPPGYYITWGGQFENQQRAMARLSIVVPLAIALIFLLLFFAFGTVRHAALIILNIPFALIGGIVVLWLSRLYLSVPASVGFIALFGVAVLNGVVLVSYFNRLRDEGRPIEEAILNGAVLRLRPILMTALVTMTGLIPLLLATGPGSEVQRPLAVVVIGGLFSSTVLTLLVLPVVYRWLEERAERPGTQEVVQKTEFATTPVKES